MQHLQRSRLTNGEQLSQEYYLQSLLQAARSCGLLTETQLQKIQLDSLRFLARQTERFTSGDSTSVRVETAQSILLSIHYTVSVYLKSLGDVESCIAALTHETIADLYKKGKALVKDYVIAAKKLYAAVQGNQIVTDNIAYNDTLAGIGEFFTAYNQEFAAHDTPVSIDYPLCNDKMDLVGVEYIKTYLQKLFWENDFCRRFSANDISALLHGYDPSYEDLLINIFSLVAANAVGAVVAEKPGLQLDIAPADLWLIKSKLTGLSSAELTHVLQAAAWELGDRMMISDTMLRQHIAAAVEELSVRVKRALEIDRLESVFVHFGEARQPALRFEEGEPLDDAVFRRITDEIRACRYIADKIAIIKGEIHSITDLVDMLEADCLFADEFTSVFASLDDAELAMLCKRLPTHLVDATHHITKSAQDWHEQFARYLLTMEELRRTRICLLAEEIRSQHQ